MSASVMIDKYRNGYRFKCPMTKKFYGPLFRSKDSIQDFADWYDGDVRYIGTWISQEKQWQDLLLEWKGTENGTHFFSHVVYSVYKTDRSKAIDHSRSGVLSDDESFTISPRSSVTKVSVQVTKVKTDKSSAEDMLSEQLNIGCLSLENRLAFGESDSDNNNGSFSSTGSTSSTGKTTDNSSNGSPRKRESWHRRSFSDGTIKYDTAR